jgi:hypothetical protein
MTGNLWVVIENAGGGVTVFRYIVSISSYVLVIQLAIC